MPLLENLNIEANEVLVTPEELKAQFPASEEVRESVRTGRDAVRAIVARQDHRLLVVVGPCSIHDTAAALEYAGKLKVLSDEIGDSLLLVMRAYFEKPRTTTGWKGLINDPHLDDSFDVSHGLQTARQLLLDLASMGLPLSTEALDPITPQYLQDLISWSAIGARTTESQTHREMASGLSSPIGFKNGTDGSLDVAINALQSVAHPHRFLGINASGQVSVVHTRGNPYSHVVLRGGTNGANYSAEHVARCETALRASNLHPSVMVDCSHANSDKDHKRQPVVARDVVDQIRNGNQSIIGLMMESHLMEGAQKLKAPQDLQYGVSITDACMGWETTEDLLRELAATLRGALISRSAA
jgi:3-deoxy-7-phosphoheptulonate synthase